MSLREKMRKENHEGVSEEVENTDLIAPVIEEVDKVDLSNDDLEALGTELDNADVPERTEEEIDMLADVNSTADVTEAPEDVVESTDETESLVSSDDETEGGKAAESKVKRPEILPGSRESAAGLGNIAGVDSK